MAQVAGRAGRGVKPGRALVQTYLPEHPLMQALKRGDRDGYLNLEKAIRESAGLPPYGRLAAIIISGTGAGADCRGARSLPLELSRQGEARGEYSGLPQAVAEGR